jgi:hypothetical protein
VCIISALRLATLVQISEGFAEQYNDMTCEYRAAGWTSDEAADAYRATDYTSPVFYWTNIELAMAVVSACLPTLRPLWLHFRPRPQPSSSYELGASKSSGGYSKVWSAGQSRLSRPDDSTHHEEREGMSSPATFV